MGHSTRLRTGDLGPLTGKVENLLIRGDESRSSRSPIGNRVSRTSCSASSSIRDCLGGRNAEQRLDPIPVTGAPNVDVDAGSLEPSEPQLLPGGETACVGFQLSCPRRVPHRLRKQQPGSGPAPPNILLVPGIRSYWGDVTPHMTDRHPHPHSLIYISHWANKPRAEAHISLTLPSNLRPRTCARTGNLLACHRELARPA